MRNLLIYVYRLVAPKQRAKITACEPQRDGGGAASRVKMSQRAIKAHRYHFKKKKKSSVGSEGMKRNTMSQPDAAERHEREGKLDRKMGAQGLSSCSLNLLLKSMMKSWLTLFIHNTGSCYSRGTAPGGGRLRGQKGATCRSPDSHMPG